MDSCVKFEWSSLSNELLLNPRMPQASREIFERAWKNLVEGRFQAQVGIATSGSSGESFGKLIVIGKEAILANARSANERLQSGRRDVWMKTLPSFHVGGLSILARGHLSGAQVIEASEQKWDAGKFYEQLCNSKSTLLSLVPSQLFDLIQLGQESPPALRAAILGGARLTEDLRVRALELKWPVLPSYGMTECSSQIATAVAPEDPKLRALSHAELRIGENDRIEVRSRALLTARIEFDVQRQATLSDPKTQGWFAAEDRGRIEADGSLTVLGRTADFVKIGGEGVVISRLEETLESLKLKMEIGFDVALLAAADERLGAKIILMTTAQSEKVKPLVDAFDRTVMPFEKIRNVYRVDEIPRSSLGKLLRGQALSQIGLRAP